MEYTFGSFTKGNRTTDLSEIAADVRINASTSFPATALLLLANTTSPRRNLAANSSRTEFQFYLIGVYSFFALLFGIGLLVILCQKLQNACCSSSNKEQDTTDCESLLPNIDDSPVFERHLNVDPLDTVRTHQGHDSDYENYSDESDLAADTRKDKPPDYEHPPSYAVVLQK